MSIVNDNYTNVLKTQTKIEHLFPKMNSGSVQDMNVLRS